MQHSRLPVSATAAKSMIMMAASAAASLAALRFGFVGHLDVVTTVAVGRSVGQVFCSFPATTVIIHRIKTRSARAM